MVAMTWLSPYQTVTVFQNIQAVVKLHSHAGRTVAVLEGRKKDERLYLRCKEEARMKKSMLNAKQKVEDSK